MLPSTFTPVTYFIKFTNKFVSLYYATVLDQIWQINVRIYHTLINNASNTDCLLGHNHLGLQKQCLVMSNTACQAGNNRQVCHVYYDY